MAWRANVWASQRYNSTSLCRRSRFCERLPSVTSRTHSGMEPRGRRRRASVIFEDRKSTRLNSSHLGIPDAGFCLKKIISEPVLHLSLAVLDLIVVPGLSIHG